MEEVEGTIEAENGGSGGNDRGGSGGSGVNDRGGGGEVEGMIDLGNDGGGGGGRGRNTEKEVERKLSLACRNM